MIVSQSATIPSPLISERGIGLETAYCARANLPLDFPHGVYRVDLQGNKA